MSAFIGSIRTEWTHFERDGRAVFKLLEPFSYRWKDETITVPAGFYTDFGSIPSFARGFISVVDRAAPATLIHDWLLVEGSKPKRVCHKIFRDCLAEPELGVVKWKQFVMYWAVRYLARLRWNHHASNQVPEPST